MSVFVFSYLAVGVCLNVFLHIFYQWMPGISAVRKVRALIFSTLFWPVMILIIVLQEGLE